MKTITPRDDAPVRYGADVEKRRGTATSNDDAELAHLRQRIRVAAIAALGVLVTVSVLLSSL